MEAYAPIHPDRPIVRAVVAVAIALCVHAVALALLFAWALTVAAAAKKAEAARPKEVSLARLDAEQWERNRTIQSFVPSAAFDNPESPSRSGERARFLSDKERHVERETVAKPAPGMPGKLAQGSGAVGPVAPGAARPSLPDLVARGTTPGEPLDGAAEGPGPRRGAALADLEPRPQPARPLVMNFDVVGEGGVPDIDGVAVGNLTVLNAEAWRYATFFDRVGATLYGVWRVDFIPRPPVPSIAARPKGGSVRAAFGVTLDSQGRAVEVAVRRSSGLPDVDDLLAELIRKSAPFPNMPPGLLDSRGSYSDIWIIGLSWGWRQP